MGKKNKTSKRTNTFQKNPFGKLKGFSVSGSQPELTSQSEQEMSGEELFTHEMNMLGVNRSSSDEPSEESGQKRETPTLVSENITDQELFLAALGEMPVNVESCVVDEKEPQRASPRRLKLLKQGQLKPEATLDLHGMLRHQVVEKVRFFIQDAKYQGYETVLIITGRGLHSEGEPVLRSQVEQFLRETGAALLTEWVRAPRQYGGAGALIVFLK